MKTKKLISLLLLSIILISEFSLLSFAIFSGSTVTAVTVDENEAIEYFGRQLTEAKKFYDVMMDMYTSGDFAKGESREITDKVTQEELASYASGAQHLLNMVTAARDAFQYDVPGAFYIDFSALSLRVTLDSSEQYHAYIGAGRRDDYFLPGFTAENIPGAVEKYNEKLNKIVDEVEKTAGESPDDDALTRAAHDWVTKNMDYKFEYQVTKYSTETQEENPNPGVIPCSNARTAYDCFFYGEGVCEAYTRGFKAIMDKLGIPCVCVYGIYEEGASRGEHIWNHVKIGDTWYGVDVTQDDPAGYGKKESGKEHQTYCLVGALSLNTNHIPVRTLSASGYEFSYPGLPDDVFQKETGTTEYYSYGGFKIKVEDIDTTLDGEKWSAIALKVSYNGKNDTQNVESNTFIVSRMRSSSADTTDELGYTEWVYIGAKAAEDVMEKDKHGKTNYDDDLGNYIYFEMETVESYQFAVTDIPPKGWEPGKPNYDGVDLFYQEDETLLKEKTKEFVNPYPTFVASPSVKTTVPSQQAKLIFGKEYEITLEFNDAVVPDENYVSNSGDIEFTPPSNVKIEGNSYTYDQVGKLKLTAYGLSSKGKRIDKTESAINSNISISYIDLGERTGKTYKPATIKFKFKPDTNFVGNETVYTFTWVGVKGAKEGSGTPNSIGWSVGSEAPYVCWICIARGDSVTVFGQPELLASDIPEGSIVDADGEEVDLSEITNRISLITTSVSEQQEQEMQDMMNEVLSNPEALLDSQSYNIALHACNGTLKQINGARLKVCVGFPQGVTYEQFLEGQKTFTAYHYKHDKAGNIIGVEEIPVEVTRQGLILYVESFSPFTIATLQGDGNKISDRKVTLASSEGGTVTFAEGTTFSSITTTVEDKTTAVVTDNTPVTINVKADEGKTIDNIAYGEKTIDLTKITQDEEGNDIISFTVNAKDLEAGTTRIVVSFASKTVVAKEEGKSVNGMLRPTVLLSLKNSASSKFAINTANHEIDVNVLSNPVNALLEEINTIFTIKVLDKDGKEVKDNNKYIGTGYQILVDDDVKYSAVVYGDITGDGIIDSLDVREWMVDSNADEKDTGKLRGVFLKATDFNRDGKYNSNDLRDMLINLNK